MKPLQTYLIEAIKPPRLSAKNKHLWANNKPLDEKEVVKWIEDNCRVEGSVEMVDDKINVRGDVGFTNKYIEVIPYPFGEVTGDFNCIRCIKLKSLKNCPRKVSGFFSCSYCNNLTSLEGAPEEVGDDFYCYHCSNLKSLEGAPEEVGGKFSCGFCGEKFTEEDIRKVCRVKGRICV